MRKVDEIKFYGKLIEDYNLISSHGGNISVRINDNIVISKTGTMIGHLNYSDVTVVSINNEHDKNLQKASMELIVHKAIYQSSSANAIIHTHPEYTIILSFFYDKIIPVDSEGKYSVGEIPVIDVKNTIASKEVAEEIKRFTNIYKAAVVKSHGLFVWAESLEKAFYYTTSIEKSSKILYLFQQWKRKKN